MALGTDVLCADCDGDMASLQPLDRIVTVEDEIVCRRCLNKRRVRMYMEHEHAELPPLVIGSLGVGKSAKESMDALVQEQGALMLELFSEGL